MFKVIKDYFWPIISLLFSGIGTAIFIKTQTSRLINQNQSSGDNSKNIQAGGNVTLGGKIDENQEQKAGHNSINIQAKGNISYTGLSPIEVKDLVLALIKSELFYYQKEAMNLIEARIDHLSNRLISAIQKRLSSDFSAFKDPDFQYVLQKAGTQYARTGEQDAENLIIDLITERAKEKTRGIRQIVLNETLEICPKLTSEQLKILASIFIPKYVKLEVTTIESLCEFVNNDLLTLSSPIELQLKDLNFNHLEYLGCISISIGSTTMFSQINDNYKDIFSNIFDHSLLPSELNFADIIEDCGAGSLKFKIKSNTELEAQLKSKGISENIIEKAIELHNTQTSVDKMLSILNSKCPQLKSFSHSWDNSLASHSSLTSVGQALAISYLRSTGNDKYIFDTWLK